MYKMIRQGGLTFKTVNIYKGLFGCIQNVTHKNITRYINFSSKKYLPQANLFLEIKQPIVGILMGMSIFTWLGLEREHTDEDDLILNIKRSILLIQRKEFEKAEQMLHLALRMAQQTSNQDGITYIYDVMANLALEQRQLVKAEKLFVSVMQRLISNGLPNDDIKNIHISLKLARIYDLQGDSEKAGLGFTWSLEKLQNINTKLNPENELLIAVAKDWYAHFLINMKSYKEALNLLTDSYEITKKFEEGNEEQIVVLLNDMANVCEINDYDTAIIYLQEATIRGQKLEMHDLGVIHINLGRLYLKKGLYDKARKSCGYGWKLGQINKNNECIEQANSCLQEIKKLQ